MLSKYQSVVVLALGILFPLLFQSCMEGHRNIEGKVLDAETNLPIDSVFVIVEEKSDTIFTNSEGYFQTWGPFGSCRKNNCPDATVTFLKSGYIKKSILNPEPGETILLSK